MAVTTKPINILHLSDLHLRTPASWDENVILKALESDLLGAQFSRDALDLIIFSGDLAYSGSSSAYDAVLDILIRVLDSAGLDESRLIICPGNHDASRTAVGPSLSALKEFRRAAATSRGAVTLFDDPIFKAYCADVFRPFRELQDQFATSSRIQDDVFSSVYYLRGLGIAVVSLNTATLTSAGLLGENDDQDELAFSEKSLVSAFDRVPAGVPIICTGHHPLSWLNQASSSTCYRVISERAQAYLSGHLHEVSPKQATSLTGTMLEAQAGALYMGRSYWNGYAVLSTFPDVGHQRIAYRRWFEPRREFAKAEDIANDGIFYSSSAAEAFWKTIDPQVDSVALERWRVTDLLPRIEGECTQSLSGVSIDDLFVEPEFDREVPYRTESDGRVGSRLESLTLSAMISSGTNYVVSAAAETGKSTLLKRIALLIAREPVAAQNWSIAVLIQFGSIKPYASSIEGQLRQSLPDLPKGLTVSSALRRGLLTILIDDVDFAASEKRKAVVTFVRNNAKCRFILTSSTPFVEAAALTPEIVPEVPFTRVRMKNFKKGNLLTLVENHGLRDPLEADQMVERVIRDASVLNVPLTAVTGTFLIQIIIEKPDSILINHAALIERYIEMLLEKYAPKELLPGTFDFKNKVDLLCNIAERMVLTDEYEPSENDLADWCIKYLKEYGLSYSASDLVDYFIKARIFERAGGCLRFRLRMFFEFFAATRMIDDVSFKSFVFSNERYLLFINEIGFYSALNRRDRLELYRIFGEFKRITDDIWAEGSELRHPEVYLKEMLIPGRDTTESELAEIQRSIRTPEQISQDRAALLDEDGATTDPDNQLVARGIYVTQEEKWVGHLLLLSAMIKHMELITDSDKRDVLRGVLDGWVRFAAISLGVVSDLARDRRVIFNGITYKSSLPQDLPVGELARRLTLYMPIAVAKMAALLLGTEKLKSQLEEGIGDAKEPAARQFLRLAVLSDLGVTGLSTLAEKARKGVKGSRYLEQVLARKLYEVAVRFRVGKEELDRLRSIVGDMIVQIEGTAGGTKAAERKSAVINGMQQQRLQIDVETRARSQSKS